MSYKIKAISRMVLVGAIVVIIIVGIAAGLIFTNFFQKPTPITPTSPTTATSPTTTSPSLYSVQIGSATIRVPQDFYNFILQVKNNQLKVSINFWTSMLPFEVDNVKKVVQDFMSEYPGITVKYTGTVQNMKEAIKAGVVANDVENTAHVFTWAHDWTGEMADGGYIISISDYLPPETLSDLQNQYLSIAYSAGVYKLKLYGLPWAAEAIALVINKNLVSNPPQTFDDMLNMMKQFTNPSQNKFGLAYQMDPYFLYPFITAFGGYYYNEDNDSLGVNSTGTEQGIKFWIQNLLPYIDTRDLSHEYQLKVFTDGRAPFIITGPWDIPAIKQAGIPIEVVPIPNIGDKTPKPFSGIKLLWITKLVASDKNRLFASLLFSIWFSLNDNELKMLVDKAGFIPVKKSVVDYLNQHVSDYPITAGFANSVARSIPMPKSVKMSYVWGDVSNALNAIFTQYSQKGADAAINSIRTYLNQAQQSILQKFSGKS
jgi:arabinogalactan oligomer/maltooligosaccharide transport system substrate-binding protein